MPLTPLLTEKEAASALGWSVSALQQRRFRGQQPRYLKLGGKSVRYEIQALEEFINQGRVSLQGVS
ncbi:MAG: DNA-binding protein [Deltaproteobacteria bacterium HGW-Deltaproteobacteria-8]|nr:MAG: DNA-binding protein [Deltaproteobacteria bacterium HGW-Deltaproteobacteria-8]